MIGGCVIALPWIGWTRRFHLAIGITVLVIADSIAIAFNQGRCPLTSLAARYTQDRADNFDIYLPLSIARHNKLIFGSLFALGELVVLLRWLLH